MFRKIRYWRGFNYLRVRTIINSSPLDMIVCKLYNPAKNENDLFTIQIRPQYFKYQFIVKFLNYIDLLLN